MAKTVYSTYTSDDIEIDYVLEHGNFDDIPPDVQVLSLHILGVETAFHTLPKDLQELILSLALETL